MLAVAVILVSDFLQFVLKEILRTARAFDVNQPDFFNLFFIVIDFVSTLISLTKQKRQGEMWSCTKQTKKKVL